MTRHPMQYVAAILATFLSITHGAIASDIREETVRFPAGSTGTTIEDGIKDYESVSYKLDAGGGQWMTVTLKTAHTGTYFNVYGPGKGPGDEAIAVSEMTGPMVPDLNRFDGKLAEGGTYTISVYMVRAAARRNERADYTLTVEISDRPQAGHLPEPVPGGNETGDALVPGTDFNATGTVDCVREAGQAMGDCEFGVKRDGNGNGSITVFWPDGGNRVIFYEQNTPVSYDRSEADGGAEMTVDRDDTYLYTVTIGGQKFKIPEAVMTGG